MADMKIEISKDNVNNLVIDSQLQTYIYNQDIETLIKEGVKDEQPSS